MSIPDDELRFLFAKAFERSVPDDSCPEPERLFDAVHGSLPESEAHQIVDHMATCPVCAEAWRLARDSALSTERE